MTKLLEIKDQLIRFYSKYETYLYPIVKFAVALALFTVINTNIGFMEKISRFPVALLLALVCAILPTGAILWIGAICGACRYVCAFHGSSTYRTDFVCDSVLCIFSFRTERRTDGCAYTAVF